MVGGELFPISSFNAERTEEQSRAERNGRQGNGDGKNRRTSSQAVIPRFSAVLRSSAISAFSVCLDSRCGCESKN